MIVSWWQNKMMSSDTESSLNRQLIRLIKGDTFNLSRADELRKLHLKCPLQQKQQILNVMIMY